MSVSGPLEVEVLEVVGREVQERTVLRRVVYLVCWSGVRVRGGGGVDVEVGWMKGVFMGLREPSMVVAILGVVSLTSVEDWRADLTSGAWPLLLVERPVIGSVFRESCSIGIDFEYEAEEAASS